MRKALFVIVPLLAATVVFLVITFFLNNNSGKGALQVTANPKSNVYLNGKSVGQSPLCKCEMADMIQAGEYTIRLEPLDTAFSPFEEKITITKSVLTVVDRTFGKGATSDGSIITLNPISSKKDSELLVVSFPSNAQVFVDNNLSGTTPVIVKDLTESDHEVKFFKEGYKEKIVRIRTIAGYKLSVTVFLGIDQEQAVNASPSVPASVQKTTPTPVISKIVILQTPTGFLRVRENSSLSSAEIARVTPGESYELISETEGWYQIKLADERVGWVSSRYAQKQ